MKKTPLALCALLIATGTSAAFANPLPRPPSADYLRFKSTLAKGCNTWNVNSMLSHVLLPEGFAKNLTLKSTGYLRQTLPNVTRASVREIILAGE